LEFEKTILYHLGPTMRTGDFLHNDETLCPAQGEPPKKVGAILLNTIKASSAK
jgi:hypothetical protein